MATLADKLAARRAAGYDPVQDDWQPLPPSRLTRAPRLTLSRSPMQPKAHLNRAALAALGIGVEQRADLRIDVTPDGRVRIANGPNGDVRLQSNGQLTRLASWATRNGFAPGRYELEQRADGALYGQLRREETGNA